MPFCQAKLYGSISAVLLEKQLGKTGKTRTQLQRCLLHNHLVLLTELDPFQVRFVPRIKLIGSQREPMPLSTGGAMVYQPPAYGEPG